ncbi:PAS domain S-box-containing protein/diguanylate cyclase (GGDEF) domain-containing protein [Micromonospora pattaloongensis]|uniref:PAS domain S-box-containing protein/diguanylate cyclase (GGDEF) domain-containing protein n=1 Tax=Micromonospora pattaloongensis TaxID=405436 RepID=A0A1H3MYV7_9ACTN|nr:GGDEF domain-containing protein [Micromonospora pattaloongensis]SDY81786.1 PAS domain S-box-containing protein/diguanylate cyclase (GGDEF) domain-containing protein [Micromonospora pattaloongensis]
MTARSVEARRLQAVVDIARTMTGVAPDQRQVSEAAARAVTELLGDGCSVWLTVPGERTGLARAGAAHRDPRAERLLRHGGDLIEDSWGADLLYAVLEAGIDAILGPAEVAAHLDGPELGAAPWNAVDGLGAVAVVPLGGDGSVRGVLVATREAGKPTYADGDVAFLHAVADTAAATLVAIDRLAFSTAAVDDMRRQAELVDQVSDVIIAWDAEDRVVNWNSAAERVYLYSAAEALGCDAQALLATQFISTATGEAVSRADLLAELGRTGVWNGELRQRRADGDEVQLLCSMTAMTDQFGHVSGAIAINRDVTEHRREEKLALHDALTGLPNRRFLLDHLAQVLNRCAAGAGLVAVLFLDLDGFKRINDDLGHEAGDEVLRVTAERLWSSVRRHDVAARLGGDEFVVVAEQVRDRWNAEELGRRLIAAIGEPVVVAGRTVRVTPSIGVTLVDAASAPLRGPDEVIRSADAAMYTAKRGRSGVSFAA